MPISKSQKLTTRTPVIFADGTQFFTELSKKYLTHKKGLFILAPSGSGKTYFTTRQEQPNWIDGDYLWAATNADLSGDKWGDDFEVVQEINNRSDVITQQAKKLGFWVIGSSNNSLKPDAIVLLPWNLHKRYILKRHQNNYDGGATPEDLLGVIAHRRWIRKWKKQGVPCFASIEDAVDYLCK